jgi:transcriptional regulator with XRE-family HTH domain
MKGSQTQLAAIVGVTPAAISRFKSGQIRPSYAVAKRLAEATGSTVGLWMEGTPKEIAAVLNGWWAVYGADHADGRG